LTKKIPANIKTAFYRKGGVGHVKMASNIKTAFYRKGGVGHVKMACSMLNRNICHCGFFGRK
jgi:nitrogenase subunit NifH